ncbi:MAG: hypothetical protein IT428_24415 [Planctomycetaceae bacterium]|nr:hypothetical protein [Planctomycetaceae bacterium]
MQDLTSTIRPILNAYADAEGVPFVSPVPGPTTQLPVYDGLLRLRGTDVAPAGRLHFRLFVRAVDTGDFSDVPVTANATVDAQGNWAANLRLSTGNSSYGRLIVASEEGNRLVFAVPLSIRGSVVPFPATAPQIKNVGGRDLGANETTVRTSLTNPVIKVSAESIPGMYVAILDETENVVAAKRADSNLVSLELSKLAVQSYRLTPVFLAGSRRSAAGPAITLDVQTRGPRVVGLIPPNFGTAPGVQTLEIRFNPENPLAFDAAKAASQFFLIPSRGTGLFNRGEQPLALASGAIRFDPTLNSVFLTHANLPADIYQLVIRSGTEGVKDAFGNPLEGVEGKPNTDFVAVIGKPVEVTPAEGGSLPPSVRRGLAGRSGDYVAFKEYEPRRTLLSNFNPSDKVVTRVARLYYFRDAHRVAQIINRKAQSYNRQSVDTLRLLADKTARAAEALTDQRQAAERSAAQAAQDARGAEGQLQDFQNALIRARDQLTFIDRQIVLATTEEQKKALQPDRERAAGQVTLSEQRVNAALTGVQAARTQELKTREESLSFEARETRSYEDAFRRGVSAETADVDTYAAGVPRSDDPVEQVSVSVIGEGVIQLRGPLKGVNVIRTMINEIDAPVGQVRIGIHTVQVNGERGDRMEPVVMRIQRYIDHSKFLTVQSAQMLRNAVVTIASQRAEAIAGECVGVSQSERDRKYLESFFGREFIAELVELDSEFLHTGNKLLSLHSMDTTSLASALFLLALAKNDVRMEILQEFDRRVRFQLPCDESEYFAASGAEYKFGPPCHKKEFQFFAQNGKFVSFRGFFNAQVEGSETINPLQREFIRLAQIFKSRLVTEIEWQQRVTERSVIEERLGDYLTQLNAVFDKERKADEELEARFRARREEQIKVLATSRQLAQYLESTRSVSAAAAAELRSAEQSLSRALEDAIIQLIKNMAETPNFVGAGEIDAEPFVHQLRLALRCWDPEEIFRALETIKNGVLDTIIAKLNRADVKDKKDKIEFFNEAKLDTVVLAVEVLRNRSVTFELLPKESGRLAILANAEGEREAISIATDTLRTSITQLREIRKKLDFLAGVRAADKKLELVLTTQADPNELLPNAIRIVALYKHYLAVCASFEEALRCTEFSVRKVASGLSDDTADVAGLHRIWLENQECHQRVQLETTDEVLGTTIRAVGQSFLVLLESDLRLKFAKDLALNSRRPLDHKKFLDMLIDDVEDKYIELLEGTRAHTANVDNYLSRLGTALEDDFNTQFYQPAFRALRETSRYWDVQFGQIEHTSILTNNRTFAKVSPQAVMEFDLPKRGLLMQEAFEAAAAAYQDYGALMGDPNFLTLTKMYSGQPTSAPFLGAPNPMVRDVLPGLPSSTDEKLLVQAPSGRPDFASQLEGLVPDPAIYKFETGTGFEIRPVIQPDGQAVVFHLQYMYTTNVREPVRGDEKHLGRIKRHFIDTDVQLGNYELREVSRYQVALKASRTARGVPLLEDLPALGVLFRPLPQQESSLQENIILAQSAIFPTLFDLMGLRWAPAVADLDTLRLKELEFVTRGRQKTVRDRVFDYSTHQVDTFLRVPPSERRPDLYRTQETIPSVHPNGYSGPGLNLRDSQLQEGYDIQRFSQPPRYTPGASEPFVPSTIPSGPPLEGIPGPPTGAVPLMRTGEKLRPPVRSTRQKAAADGETSSYRSAFHIEEPAAGSVQPGRVSLVSGEAEVAGTSRRNPAAESSVGGSGRRSLWPSKSPGTPPKIVSPSRSRALDMRKNAGDESTPSRSAEGRATGEKSRWTDRIPLLKKTRE